MPTPWKRDLDADRKSSPPGWSGSSRPTPRTCACRRWCSRSRLRLLERDAAVRSRLARGRARAREGLVVRIQPIGYQVFPEYDLGAPVPHAWSCWRRPTCRCRACCWLEPEDTSVFGAPFYVMSAGARPRADRQSAVPLGRLADGGDARRARGDLARRLRVHGAHPSPRSRRDRLRLPADARSWARPGSSRSSPTTSATGSGRTQGAQQSGDRGGARLAVKNKPSGEPEVLVWGDARIGNMIFDGTKPAAVLDWEMVLLGSPEKDVGWAIFLDKPPQRGARRAAPRGLPQLRGHARLLRRALGPPRAQRALLPGLRGLPLRDHHAAHRAAVRALRADEPRSRAPLRARQHGHASAREASRPAAALSGVCAGSTRSSSPSTRVTRTVVPGDTGA